MVLGMVSWVQLLKLSKRLLIAGYTEIWVGIISIASTVAFPFRFNTYNVVPCK